MKHHERPGHGAGAQIDRADAAQLEQRVGIPVGTSAASDGDLRQWLQDEDDVVKARRIVAVHRAAYRVVRSLLLVGVPLFLAWAVFLPCSHGFAPQCRSRQSEAKSNLKALYVVEEIHRGDHDTYTPHPERAGFEPRGSKLRYRYSVLQADDDQFVAVAVGLPDEKMAGDVWLINEKNELTNVVNRCQ